MADTPLRGAVQQIRRLAELDAPRTTDGQMLERFLADQDQGAFAELVRRLGPLVLGVCRRLLHNSHDVEDAFQATFLVLVRKAGSIARREAVGGWLHQVAWNAAIRARARTQRQAMVERAAAMTSDPPAPPAKPCELFGILDEEVNRLPTAQRQALVLCYLEGKTNEEAAAELGCPVGTLTARLSRAREQLRERLARKGQVVSVAALAGLLAPASLSAAVPPALAEPRFVSGCLPWREIARPCPQPPRSWQAPSVAACCSHK